jgi:hypothetical protein
MGLLDAYAAQADTTAQNPLQVLPRTAGERFSAEIDAATAPDRWFNLNGARRDWYRKTIDELHAETGQTYLNPQDPVTPEEMQRLGNQPAIIAERTNKIIDANRALREVKPDAINAEGIDTFIGVEGEAARQKAASYVGTGNGLAAFAGGMVAPTPENALGLLIPPSKFLLGATGTVRGFMAGLGREALYQAGAMGGLSAASEALDTASRSETGTAPTLGESVANVASSTVGGAFFGGAFHVLHAGPKALFEHWQGLKPEVRANAPLEVKDAMHVIEREALYGDTNRFGIPWDVHDQLQTDTLRSVLTGTPIRPLDTTDTAMTALGTILRDVPQKIDVQGLQGIMARTTGMTDQDIEGIARELKPQSFVALDAAEAKLKALDERVAAIHQEAQQIGAPDVIDMDTAAILHDIETKLQEPNLRRVVREELEHQRQQWLETLDVHGGLTNELQKMRTEFFPEHGPALQQIAEERAQVTKERDLAKQEAQREVDFLKSKLDQIRTGKPEDVRLDTIAPAPDFAKAIQAAEFERHARVLRENLPTTRTAEARPAAQAEPAKAVEVTPDVQKAIDSEVGRILSTPGALGDFRAAAIKELDGLDKDVRDAQAALKCAGGAQ